VSSVILRTIKHRLAELMKKPGGVSLEQALAQCDADLAAKAGPALEVIATRVAALEALASAPELDAAAVEEAYGLASNMVDVTGCLNMPALFVAAYSLCDILDAFRAGQVSRQAFQVHVRALRLILVQGETPDIEGVLEGLKAVKDRMLAGKLEE
jgi:hypothetical protein